MFVVHYSKNNERYKDLGFNERWVTEWDKEDTFVKWVKWYTKSPLSVSQLSCFLKHVWCLKNMEKTDMIVLEDDVVFENDWFAKFNTIQRPENVLFIKLGSIFKDIPYTHGIYQIGNPGGTEALWIHKKFAEVALDNLNFEQTVDIFYGAVLNMLCHPILCVPVCSQTSTYTQNTTINADTNKDLVNWINYINHFDKFKKYSFEQLWSEYEKFMINKTNWETKFNERFNCNIQLNDYNYLGNL